MPASATDIIRRPGRRRDPAGCRAPPVHPVFATVEPAKLGLDVPPQRSTGSGVIVCCCPSVVAAGTISIATADTHLRHSQGGLAIWTAALTNPARPRVAAFDDSSPSRSRPSPLGTTARLEEGRRSCTAEKPTARRTYSGRAGLAIPTGAVDGGAGLPASSGRDICGGCHHHMAGSGAVLQLV